MALPTTIDDDVPREQYVAGAGQTAFAFQFLCFTATDLLVYKTPVGTTPSDATNILVYNVDYTVTLTALPGKGGTVTLTTGATANDTVTIVRAQPATRENFYVDGGPFSASTVNSDFDQEVLMIQQNKMWVDQITPGYNLCAPITDADRILPILPALTSWRKNAAGTAMEAYTPTQGGVALPTVAGNLASFSDTGGSLQDSGVVAGAVCYRTSVTLTAPQVYAMFAAPHNILPQVVPTTYLIVSAEFRLLNSTLAFTGGGNMTLYYDNTKTQTTGITVTSAGLMDQTTDRFSLVFNAGLTAVASANGIQKGVWLSNAGAPFATGDGSLLVLLTLVKA